MGNFIELKDLEVYKLARELSRICWAIYIPLDFQTKKIMGDQFIRAADSVGANIAEGFGRYHYLDKIRFFYTSRASLYEAIDHWAELLEERNIIDSEKLKQLQKLKQAIQIKLNNLISSTYKQTKK